MKKFLIVCAILFIAGVGCKKMDYDGSNPCGCSPIEPPGLNLVIKNTAGDDLLNEKTVGAYAKDNIQLFIKEVNGKETPINFNIRPSSAFGDEKFNFNLLSSWGFYFLPKQANKTVYLKLGDSEPYELLLDLSKPAEASLLINKKAAEREKSGVGRSLPIFYLIESN